jgi:hypothetical protein
MTTLSDLLVSCGIRRNTADKAVACIDSHGWTVTPPAPAPAPEPTPTTGTVLWTAGHETDLSEWSKDSGGGLYNSGSFEAVRSTDQHHSGSASLRMKIWAPPESGVRAFRWKESRVNRELYFSAWFYLPTDFTITGGPYQYWNLFQFKSRSTGGRNDPVWAFYVDPAGKYLKAGWGWGGTTLSGPHSSDGTSGKWYQPVQKLTLPIGRWFNLRAFLRQSKDFDGALKLWQDGTLIHDLSNVRTSYDNPAYNAWRCDDEWGCNLYSDGLQPSPFTMYVDDAEIRTA